MRTAAQLVPASQSMSCQAHCRVPTSAPGIRVLVILNIAIGCHGGPHLGRLAGLYVARVITHVKTLDRCHTQQVRCSRKRLRAGLSLRHRVAADRTACTGREFKLLDQRFSQPAWLVSDDTPRQPGFVQVVQQRQNAREQTRFMAKPVGIDLQEFITKLQCLVCIQSPVVAKLDQCNASTRGCFRIFWYSSFLRPWRTSSSFSESLMSGAVSASVPSRSKRTPRI